jgi:hypothetical protein
MKLACEVVVMIIFACALFGCVSRSCFVANTNQPCRVMDWFPDDDFRLA